MDLQGRVVVVTGARRGIGLAIARTAAARGTRVILHAREQAQAESAAASIAGGHPVRAVWGALDSVEGIRRVVEAAGRVHGGIDGLVNNAGLAIAAPSAEFTEADWDRMFAVNLKAAFFACQAALPLLRRSQAPRIVNISSLHGETAIPGRAAYAASKAALSHLTRCLAIEWAPYGITVNAIAPGYVNTEQIAHLLHREGPQIKERTPLGRIAEPDDIAAAAVYLLSDAGRHVTGEVIRVDGGWALYGGWRPPVHEREG